MAGTDEEDFTERTLTFRSPALPPRANAETPAHLLLVHAENAPPRHVPLHLLPLTVGRSAPAEVVLPEVLSRVATAGSNARATTSYCRISSSTNGTFVNSERITAPLVLEDGARITIGAHALTYHRRSQQELDGWDALERELAEASDYVLSVLPPPITSGPVQAEWYYQPCTRLGGDAFGYQMLDSRCFAAYMLDVAGHGAGAALFAVTVANVLRQRMLPEVDFREPGAVIRGLNRMFPMERHNNLFFTMW